ncbi:MAG: nitroreductase family protein [Infirmifilum uzonense]|uniref:Nitroreductase n=1 Tax=Infirmifilum uzonense TaxID=1550241 RepID=A0A0F7FGH6_9CREN|nr:nitroreductase family protein [Infirmifilum uzonense]AKG38305.1 nitroreductase [Infirmifilum uzonense]
MSCADFLTSRRSIRKFMQEQVPDDLLWKAFEIARFAPSAHNRQPWRFYLVRDRSKITRLAELHRWSKPILNAPVVVVVFSDASISPVSHIVDGSIVATYLWLALHCVGLATVWIYTLENVEEIREILDVPDNLYPIAIFPVGFPAESPPKRPRKDLKDLVVEV